MENGGLNGLPRSVDCANVKEWEAVRVSDHPPSAAQIQPTHLLYTGAPIVTAFKHVALQKSEQNGHIVLHLS